MINNVNEFRFTVLEHCLTNGLIWWTLTWLFQITPEYFKHLLISDYIIHMFIYSKWFRSLTIGTAVGNRIH